jgi:hypothetical protein
MDIILNVEYISASKLWHGYTQETDGIEFIFAVAGCQTLDELIECMNYLANEKGKIVSFIINRIK